MDARGRVRLGALRPGDGHRAGGHAGRARQHRFVEARAVEQRAYAPPRALVQAGAHRRGASRPAPGAHACHRPGAAAGRLGAQRHSPL